MKLKSFFFKFKTKPYEDFHLLLLNERITKFPSLNRGLNPEGKSVQQEAAMNRETGQLVEKSR